MVRSQIKKKKKRKTFILIDSSGRVWKKISSRCVQHKVLWNNINIFNCLIRFSFTRRCSKELRDRVVPLVYRIYEYYLFFYQNGC